MTRTQLEHILRAAAAITEHSEFVVVGSQAILGSFPDAPRELRRSMEADLFSRQHPEDAPLIDGSIGENSAFHQTFGYHAHGVGIETARLPRGWESRLVRVQSASTGGATGLCLEVHDLAVSKLVAGRDLDNEFLGVLFVHRLADPAVVRARLAETELDPRLRVASEQRLARLASV